MTAETVALKIAYEIGEKIESLSDYTAIVVEIVRKELESLPEFQGNPARKHWGYD